MNHLCPLRRIGLAALALALASPAAAAPAKKGPETARSTPTAETDAKTARPVKGKLFAIVLGPGPEWKKGQPLKAPAMPDHRRYWAQLNSEGRIAAAGPLGEDTALILMRAKNQAEANAAIGADPAVKARLLRGIARPYAAAMTNPAALAGG